MDILTLIKKILAAIFGEKNEDKEKSTEENKASQEVALSLEKQIAAYIDQIIKTGEGNPFTKTPYMKFRESEGKNRSKDIDALIIRNNGQMADAYCMFGQQDILRAVEIKFNIKFDLPRTGSTQKFFNNTKNEYKHADPKPYSLGIYQYGDEYKGHAVLCLTEYIDPEKEYFTTFEFNTSADAGPNIERDGQGCYFKKRPVDGHGSMHLRGFVDIFKAIKK